MAFERQASPEEQYLVRDKDLTVLLTKSETLLASPHLDARPIHLQFAGRSVNAALTGIDELSGKIYSANGAATGKLSSNPTYRRVKYAGVYPGIDAVYYGNERQLEFDLTVAPHANPQVIRLAFSGADKVRLTDAGEIALEIGGEVVTLRRPTIYQEHGGSRQEIAGRYSWRGMKEIGFELGAFDPSLPLIIDPAIEFATYLGSAGNERAVQLKVARSGEIYVAASSDRVSTIHAIRTFPIEMSQPDFPECFLTKLSADGSTEIYTVVFDGVGCEAMEIEPGLVHLAMGKSGNYLRTLREDANGQPASLDLLKGAYDFSLGPAELLRADNSGNVYAVVFYTPAGASNPIYELQKIDPDGKLLGTAPLITVAARRPGDAIQERVTGLDVDDAGNAYVVGVSRSNSLITPTANAFQATKPSNPADDGFLLRVNTADSRAFDIDYATFLGGSGDDEAEAVAFDPDSQTVLIAGNTASEDFPQATSSPSRNDTSGFLTRLDLSQPPGSSQLVGSVLIGPFHSTANLLTILPGGVPAIAGTELDAPGVQESLIPGDPIHPGLLRGQMRPFLRTYSPDLTQATFSTYLDATQKGTYVNALASNGSQFLYVAVSTKDGTLGTPGALQPAGLGDDNLLLRAIDATSTLTANSPLRISSKPSIKTNAVTKPAATTGAASAITKATAVVSGSVNPHGADTHFIFAYGTSSTLAGTKKTTSVDIGSGTALVAIKANLTGLTGGTKYYYRVQATNKAGATNGAIRTFTTTAKAKASKPTVTTGAASLITKTTATIAGSVIPNGADTHFVFAYGTSSTLSGASKTASVDIGSGTSAVGISVHLASLTGGTKYYYQVQATNSAGATNGVIKSFTTSGARMKPAVTTGAASSITGTTATIAGSVNPNGTDTHFVFAYGTSSTLSGAKKTTSVDIGSGTTAVSISANLTGLTGGTKYYYSVQATNSAGATNGSIHSFTTTLSGWAGQISCVKTDTGPSYSNNETQTWTVKPGIAQKPTGQTLYPTQWASTGSGSTASQTWVINASGSGQMTVFTNGEGLNFARFNSEISFPDGYQATPPPSYTDYEYQWLPFGNSNANAQHVQGSSSTTSPTCDSPVQPGGSSCTVKCSWDFTKQ